MALNQDQREEAEGRRLVVLSLAALGVVFGDIGTSPLYAIRECFHGEYAIAPSAANVYGVLSLVTWALIIVVTVKYLTFVLRADNRGEGGVIALLAQLHPQRALTGWKRWVLLSLGLFGASLLYGDGMITPAISVTSAVEGLKVATPFFEPYVVPITIVILAGIFLLQRRGTGGVGALFGPVTLVWFVVISVLGVTGILRGPEVVGAVSPHHAVTFFLENGLLGFFVLGAVFLVVTGAEALYADMGHFGRRPIRLAWAVLVLPALLLNYYGQGALLLHDAEAAHNPFYALAPAWALYPLVVLATAATIIASQAVISGAFSLTRQAIQLGYCPRLKIVHTSPEAIGQIYVPPVNWILMVCTIALVLGFQSSSKLAAAYGVAVTTTMLIATLLFFVVARMRFGWGLLAAGVPTLVFLVVDLSFFGANIGKVAHGAWFPLAIALVGFTLLSTWKRGREVLAERFRAKGIPLEDLAATLAEAKPQRVPGTAVYMTGSLHTIPPALLHNLEHNKVLHEKVLFVSVVTEEIPRVPVRERVEMEGLGDGISFVILHYGFMEDPNVPRALRRLKEKGLDVATAKASYFLGRERLIARKEPGMARWRERLFAFMARNAQGATAFFQIPPDRVLEVGAQVEL